MNRPHRRNVRFDFGNASRRVLLGCAALLLAPSASAGSAGQSGAPAADIFTQIADEVSDKMLASAAFQERAAGGRKARIVIGDVVNNSDNEGVRLEDIFNEIRNKLVATGTARLFAPGELNADFVISPELTSDRRVVNRKNLYCVTLQLTLTTISGEYIAAHGASRCR